MKRTKMVVDDMVENFTISESENSEQPSSLKREERKTIDIINGEIETNKDYLECIYQHAKDEANKL